MPKTFMILALAALLASPPLKAAPSPEGGKAAIVEAVVGRVRIVVAGKSSRPKVGQLLDYGTSVRTGPTGRVSLRNAGLSVTRLAPNSELTLEAPGKRKGTFLRLTKGLGRFLVGKRARGHAFEVATQNAVAAVKGTDMETDAGDGRGPTTAKVFESGNPVALELRDAKSGESKSIGAGQKLVFDGKEFKMENLTEQEREESERNYEGLPSPDLGGGEGDGNGEGAGGEAAGLEAMTDEAMADAMEDLYLDGFLERDERTGDIAAGKIVYDRFGQRVQVTHFITREVPETVDIYSFSERDGGPNAGVSFALESATFNKPLPDDWGAIFAGPLEYSLDPNGFPNYFRTDQAFLAGNPHGDTVMVLSYFSQPMYKGDYMGNVTGPLVQIRDQALYLNGNYAFETTYGYYEPVAGVVDTSSIYPTSPGNYDWDNSIAPFEGGWQISFTAGYPGNPMPPFMTADVHLLQDDGSLLAHPGMPGPRFSAFHGLDANIEIAFGSSYFSGRTIDLIFLPGFLDLYQIFETLTDSQFGS